MKRAVIALLALCVGVTWVWAQEDTTEVRQGWLGVYTESLSKPMLIALNMEHGVLVSGVVEGSPAQSAGLETGDVIVEVAGQKADGPHALRELVRDRPDQTVDVLIRRRGQSKKVSVTLGARKKEGWDGQFDLPELPRLMKPANEALRKAVVEMREKMESALPMDSLRKQLDELRKEVEQLKEKLQQHAEEK